MFNFWSKDNDLKWYKDQMDNLYQAYDAAFADMLLYRKELVIANRALTRKSKVIAKLKQYLKEYEKKYGKLK